MIGREQILRLVPHQGAMCLWDEVLEWGPEAIRLRADNHRDPAHPLRADGRLHAVHLCEYGAQAMAVHGGLLAGGAGRPADPGRSGGEAGDGAAPGMLVALRGVELRVARIDDLPGPLEGVADLLASSPAGQQYGFRISHAGILLAQGRATVLLPP